MFEKINTAYELLSSDAGRSTMPDAHRIVLFLQAQSIIYSRHSQGMTFSSIDGASYVFDVCEYSEHFRAVRVQVRRLRTADTHDRLGGEQLGTVPRGWGCFAQRCGGIGELHANE